MGPGFEEYDDLERFSEHACNNDYISSLICPSRFFERKTLPYPEKVAIATGSVQYSITTTSTGDALFWINP